MNRDKEHGARSHPCDTGEEFTKGTRALSRLRVLLIDDMEPLLFTLGSGLKPHGHCVFTARSGREALELCETNRIAAVICDLNLEDMNGMQVIGKIKEMSRDDDRAGPAVIVMTGMGLDANEQEKLHSLGVDMVLEKPIEISELMEALQTITRS